MQPSRLKQVMHTYFVGRDPLEIEEAKIAAQRKLIFVRLREGQRRTVRSHGVTLT